MAIAEGKVLEFKSPDTVDNSILETFPYSGPKQRVQYSTNEFTAVCPFSGLPDIGSVTIDYMPGNKCVELKSLKYYLLSYRDVGIYQEHVTAKLYEDISKVLQAQEMTLTVVYQTRGGIDTVCKIDSNEQK
ncbi:MAG TPA: preQ(1) synthase [Oligoflexia bacterium]|nr:preQ(1) synthase [Oligoflexia bacterium]HMR23971.1 preQ(1) synthase [Oligoflexia bacterium]